MYIQYYYGLTHVTGSRFPLHTQVLCVYVYVYAYMCVSVCVCVELANGHRPVVQDGPAVGADACPSARVGTFAPVSLIQEGEMCRSVLATVADRST